MTTGLSWLSHVWKTMKKILGEISATNLHLLQPPEKRWKDILLFLPVEQMSIYCMTSSEECFHIEHESECPASTSCYYMFFKNRHLKNAKTVLNTIGSNTT